MSCRSRPSIQLKSSADVTRVKSLMASTWNRHNALVRWKRGGQNYRNIKRGQLAEFRSDLQNIATFLINRATLPGFCKSIIASAVSARKWQVLVTQVDLVAQKQSLDALWSLANNWLAPFPEVCAQSSINHDVTSLVTSSDVIAFVSFLFPFHYVNPIN